MIVEFVSTFRDESRSREPTLVALSCACRALNKFAEEFIYKHPGYLHHYNKKWKFLFSLKIRPTRATLVRSLLLDWTCWVENNDLAMDIIASCSNVEHLRVGQSDFCPGVIHVDHLEKLQFILSSCTRLKSLYYFTWLPSDNDAQKRLSDWISGYTRAKKSLKQLETLTLTGPSGWLLHSSLRYFSCNLTSLQLGWNTFLGFSHTPLFDISQQCQKLKVLVVSYRLGTTDDLEKACRAWASTLETLKVDQVAENKDCISKVIPHLRKLKVLSLGRRCYVSVDGVNAIADAEMPLEWIIIMNVERPYGITRQRTRISNAANEALVNMIEAHSSTLRHVNICPRVGRDVIQACKKAKGLRSLNITLPDVTPSPIIDGLLDSCPELVDFPERFEKYSDRRSEWKDRRQFRMEMLPFQKKLLEDHA